MKHFFDTEFHEYHKQQTFLGFKIGKKTPTIDLISIGIVTDDNRTFYEISKDFNIKDAWNSYQLEDDYDVNGDLVKNIKRVYWLRVNVLKPIFYELVKEEDRYISKAFFHNVYIKDKKLKFNFKNLKYLINKYGKTNKKITEELKVFVADIGYKTDEILSDRMELDSVEFYAYYGSYDWVVLAQLFGKMINLPRGFPMFAYDLKQILDEKQRSITKDRVELKRDKNYPKQENEHNALDDAKWNKKLYEFIQSV